MEIFALCISALCHDLEHPGVNNVFLIKSRSSLVALYSDQSILEKHHSFRAFELMLNSNIDLLSGFTPEQFNEFRSLVMNIILATDMARHGEYMAKLKAYTDPAIKPEDRKVGGKKVDKHLGMEILIKCADTSNVIKPFEVAKKWAMRISDEFFLQGDMERANGMDVTPTCDRNTQKRVPLQKGFIDFVIGPFYSAVGMLLPELAESFQQLQINRDAWNAYDDAMLDVELGSQCLAQLPAIISEGPTFLRVATWNIAAVNNNPFEYWITHQSDKYAQLMNDVQKFVDSPGDRDFSVKDILTDQMFSELKSEMAQHGFPGLDELERRWYNDYRQRQAISGFLKDKAIGSKRLVSMPDRITNTINSDGRVMCRPSVISGYEMEMGHVPGWWIQWREFMFRTDVHTLDRLSPGQYKIQAVCNMIEPIKHSKYPAVTPEVGASTNEHVRMVTNMFAW